MLKKLVTISRSGYIESEHFGCGAIVDADGKILKELFFEKFNSKHSI